MDVSPDGSLLAATGGNDIVLLDAATLEERGRLQGHSQRMQVIQFSPSGALLVSGSNDRSAIVWDVATGQPREVLAGNSAQVWGVGFSPAEDTVYTIAGRTLLAWDLTGRRRFITLRPVAEPVEPSSFGFAYGSPAGDAVAYWDGQLKVQFLDLGTGRAGPVINTRHGTMGDFSWRPDGGRFATSGVDGFVRVWDWRSGELVTSAASRRRPSRQWITRPTAGDWWSARAHAFTPSTPSHWNLSAPRSTSIKPWSACSPVRTATEPWRSPRLATRWSTSTRAGDPPRRGTRSQHGRLLARWTPIRGRLQRWPGARARCRDRRLGRSAAGGPRRRDLLHGLGPGRHHVRDGGRRRGDRLLGPGHRRAARQGPPESTWRQRDEPAFLADGHTLLLTAPGGAVYTMDTRLEHWIDVACRIAGRNLTKEEWSDAFDDRPYHETCPENQ